MPIKLYSSKFFRTDDCLSAYIFQLIHLYNLKGKCREKRPEITEQVKWRPTVLRVALAVYKTEIEMQLIIIKELQKFVWAGRKIE